jgi:hypothetical protein
MSPFYQISLHKLQGKKDTQTTTAKDSAYISPFYTLSTILPSNQYMAIKLNERGGEIKKKTIVKNTLDER